MVHNAADPSGRFWRIATAGVFFQGGSAAGLFPVQFTTEQAILSVKAGVNLAALKKLVSLASVMGAFSGMSFLLMRDIINWFATNGFAAGDARRLVAETLKGNAAVLLDSPFAIAEITRGVVTPGGITETGWQNLEQRLGWPAAFAAVLNKIGEEH